MSATVPLFVTLVLGAAPGDEELLRAHKVGTDGPALLAFFRGRTPSEADARRLEALVRRLGHRSFAEREKASKALLERGEPARPFLRAALAGQDIEVTRRAERCLEQLNQGPGPPLPAAAARVLADRPPTGAVTVLLAYAPFADDETVAEAVLDALAAASPPEGKADPALLRALADASPARRAAAAHALGRHKDAAVRQAVARLLADADVQVRFRAAQALVLGRDRAGVPVLAALLSEAPLGLAWQVEEMLYRLAGDAAPSTTLGDGSVDARRRCRADWEAWWRKHGDRTDLARLRDDTGILGLTLAIEYNTNRVWECGPDGTVRWELTGLKGPMEAWVLPGNRVLVADNNGVTERDFKGNVLWRLDGTAGATGCQRLRNGNTFVSTYNRIMEFGRDGKALYAHAIPGSNAIRKHRNGNVVYAVEGAVVEVNTAGKEVRRVPLPKGFWVGVEDLSGDRFLLADSSQGRVVEVDARGKVVWEAKVPSACGVARLPNGHTLVASARRVVEVDRRGKVVWEKTVPGYARRVHRR